MRFIDVFAGLGGFHVGIRRLGHVCVFSCEIDDVLCKLYQENFGIAPAKDIRAINPANIPAHDILCAGFPCQPFSKAGSQLGTNCPANGDLFDYVVRILELHQPAYFILENVANLPNHANGTTWARMHHRLVEVGYDVRTEIMSPHQVGAPQIRNRFFAVGSRNGFLSEPFPELPRSVQTHIETVLDNNPKDARPLSEQAIECLNVWQDFLSRYPSDVQLPSFPIWSNEFGATYPYKRKTPYTYGAGKLRRWRGSHGNRLASVGESDFWSALPSYAVRKQEQFPDWKIRFIDQNRQLYAENRSWIDDWKPHIQKFPQSLQKLEWNCKGEERNIWNFIIQFRASGVRLKRPTTAPSLVAMTTTQVPIVGWERRYMTPRECARLQGFSEEELPHLPGASTRAFKALGNAVNADLAELICQELDTFA